ncbi:MAG: phosphate acyltransferase [Pseudomonadota bacterium]
MSVLSQAFDAARKKRARVVFPEADEPRVAAAIARLEAEELCVAVPLPEPSEERSSALAAAGVRPVVAKRALAKPLTAGAAAVKLGEADVMVAGADSPTKRVIEAAALVIGKAQGVAVPSSFFLMVFPDGREMVWADCAVNTYPDADGLEAIAVASAASATALLGAARVALLSFSTGASGAGPSVDMVAEVAARTGFSGPLQSDAALNASIAAKKGLGAGDANTLIFPSLDAGNVAYKLAQELAGAQALGPFLQGFARPVCDLSRGASVDDIVASTVLTIAQS